MADSGKLPKFECFSDPSTLGPRWTRWLTSFQLYADGKGLIIDSDASNATKQRRRALLLHLAGADVQEIFDTLPETGTAVEYDKAVTALNEYFIPQVNSAYARQAFKTLSYKHNETTQQFVTRLRKAAKDCEFGADAENQIRDTVLEKCTSTYIKRKLLEEGQTLTLKKTLEIAEQCEKIELQMAKLGKSEPNTPEPVNTITDTHHRHRNPRSQSGQGRERQDKKDIICYQCGKVGHTKRDPKCPARGQTCRKCGGRNHFERACKTKRKANQIREQPKDEYAFTVLREGDPSNIDVCVGGVNISMLIDSGANSNIIDEQTWEQLKAKHIKCESKAGPIDRNIYAYGAEKPLYVKGTFSCEASFGENSVHTEFIVIRGKGIPLLGKNTALKLGVLKIGPDVSMVTDKAEILKQKHPEVFKGVGKLKTKQISLDIDPSVTPVAQPYRRVPFNLRDKVNEKISELVELDIIEPVEGPAPWVNPVVIVPKKQGEIRLCIDMRQANNAITRRRYPIPTVDEVLHTMNGSTVFSKLDLKWGYHQLELDDKSREITTFAIPGGLFRYKRLLFGVNTASEQYQHEISIVLAGIEGAQNISDDIIVHAPDKKSHDRRLEQTIERLQQCGLTLNPDKCQFNMDRLVFMGILLSEKGIGPTEERVKAILEAEEPKTTTEVRSFLGLANFSSRFIPHFATLAEPLRRLTRKETPFVFGAEQKRSFEALKQSMASACTLAYFDKNADTKVIADASPVGLGAVLLQKQEGEWTPISYASRSLSDCERRYSQTEKEALGVVWSCEKFHPYIFGMRFTLETDHKPLEVIYSTRSKPCARIERWVLRLQQYNFTVVYSPGRNNIADPLSRLLPSNPLVTSHNREAEDYVRFVAVNATPAALTTREIERASDRDEELEGVRQAIETGRFDKCKQYMPVAGELCVIGKLVLRGTRIIMPKELRAQTLALAHEGHLGIVGTKQNLRTKVWWPGIDKAAEKYCRSCYECQLVSKPDSPEPLQPTTLPDGPWQDIAIDLKGPLPSGHSLLVIVDYYSRYYEVEVMQSTTTDKIIDILETTFSRHGLPLTIKSDNGPQFKSEEFKNYCDKNGITHCKVIPKWAQANGEVERQNRSLAKRLQIAQAAKKNWREELRRYLTAYRSLPHSVTGRSPAELLFNRKVRGKIPDLSVTPVHDQELQDRDMEQKAKSKEHTDNQRGATPSDVQVGDHVLVKQDKKDSLTTPFNPVPFRVIDRTGSKVVVESEEGSQYCRNTADVKQFVARDDTESVTQCNPAVDAPLIGDPRSSATSKQASVVEPTPIPARPQRNRRLPQRFVDFEMTA